MRVPDRGGPVAHPLPPDPDSAPALTPPSGPAPRRMTRRTFLSLSVGTFAAAAAGLGGYAFKVEPRDVEIVEIALTLPRLPAPFEGLRLVQISDLHHGRHVSEDYLYDVIDRVNTFQPDVIAITGDYVNFDALDRAQRLVPMLQRLRAREAVVGVMGNHDHWANAPIMRAVVAEAGVNDLRNTVTAVRRGADSLFLCGVDDYLERRARLNDVLGQLPPGPCAILLAHEPDFADISGPTGRFDLQISGHSHGGQVRLPGIGPIVLPRYGQKYPSGHYTVGTMHLYTNRGIGVTPPPVRLNCRPEITVFTLHSGNQSG